jgi:hypothetical protein
MDSMERLLEDLKFYKGFKTDEELAVFFCCSHSLIKSIRRGSKALTLAKRIMIKNACPNIPPVEILLAEFGVEYVSYGKNRFYSCGYCGLVYDSEVVHPDALICKCERG